MPAEDFLNRLPIPDRLLRDWLYSCPCVINREVLIDVRGPWPVAIIGKIARQISSRADFVEFVLEILP